jgi:hypothetical protein
MWGGIPFSQITPPALVGIFFLLVFFGRLVPWYIYKAKEKEAEKWRLAYEAEREARATSDAQTAELLELAKTTHSIIVAMFGAAQRSIRAGEAYVGPTQTTER